MKKIVMTKEKLIEQYKNDLKEIENIPDRVFKDGQYEIPCVNMSINYYRTLLKQLIIGLEALTHITNEVDILTEPKDD